jgi:NAD(P)-dependent dehydrogenase (short-subunit alcohol dehydrogenase family)
MLLENKVAVITGIGPGMGMEIAALFACEGAKLAIGARTVSRLEDVANSLRANGAEVITRRTDLTDRDSCNQLVEDAIKHYDGIDILVQNGHDPGDYKNVEDADPEQWKAVMDCNFFGSLYLVQACMPSMIERGGGSIILVNSGASFAPPAGLASYAASKAAMASLVRSLAIEMGPKGIRTNGIHLGMVEGENVESWLDMLSQQEGRSKEDIRADIVAKEYPVGHIPTPKECAGTVLFLASDLSTPLIGQAIMVNGGSLLR